MNTTETPPPGSLQRMVRCVCGGEHFHRNYPVAGRWCEFVKANASGGVEVIESTTDGLTRGKEPMFMRCDKCGKRVRNPEAPNDSSSATRPTERHE